MRYVTPLLLLYLISPVSTLRFFSPCRLLLVITSSLSSLQMVDFDAHLSNGIRRYTALSREKGESSRYAKKREKERERRRSDTAALRYSRESRLREIEGEATMRRSRFLLPRGKIKWP